MRIILRSLALVLALVLLAHYAVAQGPGKQNKHRADCNEEITGGVGPGSDLAGDDQHAEHDVNDWNAAKESEQASGDVMED